MITLINGRVQNASSIFVPNGSISFSLNVDATVLASPFGFVCADIPIVFQLDANGNLVQPCQIWSNRELEPQNASGLGTWYLVTIYDSNGCRLNAVPMSWQFQELANATVDISTMTAYQTGAGTGGNVLYYPLIPTILGVMLNPTSDQEITGSFGLDLTDPGSEFSVAADALVVTAANLSYAGGSTSFSTASGFSVSTLGSTTFSTAGFSVASSSSISLSPTSTFSVSAVGSISLISASTFGIIAAGAINVAAAGGVLIHDNLSLASQPTFRLTDSELGLNFAGSTTISSSGSVAGVRGNISQVAGNTLAAGFEYGVQGKLTLAGTLVNGSGFNAGVFGQIDTSASTFVHTSGYLAPIMGDFGATSIMASDANANMVTLLNTTNCIIHSAILFNGNASYFMDVTDLAYGGAHFVQAQTGITTLSKSLKIIVDGTTYYIPLCTGVS